MMDCAAVRGGSRGAGAGRGGRNRRGPHTPSISTGRNKPLARRPRRAYFYRVFATQSPKNKDKKGPQGMGGGGKGVRWRWWGASPLPHRAVRLHRCGILGVGWTV